MIVPENCDYLTFVEGASSLDGKEDLLVEMNITSGLLDIAAGSNPVLGVYKGKLSPGMKNCKVAPVGEGQVRMVQEAAIGVGLRVQQGTDATKVKARATSGLNLGIKVWPRTDGAAGDIILVQGRLEVS